jgi:hypothetical protein
MEKVHVPSKRTVKFKIGRLMKEQLFNDRQTGQPRPQPSAAGSGPVSFSGRSQSG